MSATDEHAGDLELVRRALEGDSAAVEALVARLACVPPILRAKNHQLGSPFDAEGVEEIVQETLLALWSKLPAYQGRAKLETWAYGFCTNQLWKALERRSRSARIELSNSEPAAGNDVSDGPPISAPEIEHSLERLSPETADVIRSHHFEQLSFEDIARRDRTPLNTVKARYYRGLVRLRALLAARWRKVTG